MTWSEVAAEHIGHRCVLDDPRTLRCVDCTRKLVLPKPPDAETPSPPPFRFDRDDLRGMPAGFRERVSAELAARRASRLSPTEQDQP